MKPLDHIVRQLSFDIQINEGASSTSLSESVANYCAEDFADSLEKQLKPYENKHAIIDRIELDLGTISSRHWERLIEEKLENVLHKQLEISLLRQPKTSGQDIRSSLPSQQEIANTKVSVPLEAPRSQSQNVLFKAFCFFLKKGYLPWWYTTAVSSSFEDLHNYKLTPYEVTVLLEILKNNPTTLKRFLATVPKNKIPLILNLKGVLKKFISKDKELHKILLHTIAPSLSKKTFQFVLWKTVIAHYNLFQSNFPGAISMCLPTLISEDPIKTKLSAQNFEQKAIAAFQKDIQNLWPNVRINKQLIVDALYPRNNNIKSGAATSSSTRPGVLQKTKSETDRYSDDTLKKEAPQTAPPSSNLLSIQKDKDSSESNRKEEQEGVYVVHAGVVLLHPLLPSFFTNLGLLKNGKWINESSSEKAVHLLAYLCTGLIQNKEEDCLLFKHICGLEWDILIDMEHALLPAEIQEAKDLLQSVIGHWSSLKNTSIDGLREGFIQRTGKLYKDDTGWQLHIEQKAQDILLKHLPWGMGIVKFPWLDQLIRITWV